MDLTAHIRAVPDFPQPGILFRDITPLLANPEAFAEVIRRLAGRYRGRGIRKVLGIESRGFVFAAPLALELQAGFIPVRKQGKLPAATRHRSYALEYGTAAVEVHVDALDPGDRVLIVDDLLATGGTARAAAELVEEAGARVEEIAFLIELVSLGGRERLQPWEIHAMIRYGAAEPDSMPQ